MGRDLLKAVMAAVAMVGLGGCAGVAWMATQLAPPPKVQAKYEPPTDKRYLVLVDDVLNSQANHETVKCSLSQQLSQRLVEHEIASSTIPYRQVVHLSTITPGYDELTIPQIGQKLGADLVLYVHIDQFELRDSPVDTLWHGQFTTSVKVVDVQAGRLWPQDLPEGHRVGPVEVPTHDSTQPAHDLAITQSLIDQMADRVAKLFYEHRVDADQLQRQQQQEEPWPTEDEQP